MPGVRAAGPDTSTSWQEEFEAYRLHISAVGVQVLDGYKLNYQMFADMLPQCVSAGLISEEDASFVLRGLSAGFDFKVDHLKMLGRRVHKNYTSAYEHKEKVHKAISKRVCTGKTLRLGAFSGKSTELPRGSGTVVPQGAVSKKYDPENVRPFSDHTKTQFNAAVDLSGLEHSLDTYNEISRELKPGYYMRVEDVDAAFPNLPLSPTIWRYMYVWWYDTDRPLADQDGPNTLYVHTFADFGAAPMPAIWDKFFRCVKAMATLEGVLTLPMPHYVDDNSVIGPTEVVVNTMADALGHYMEKLGVPFKSEKSRRAATLQLVLGFWWDATMRTRTLEGGKLELYCASFFAAAKARVLTLHEASMLFAGKTRLKLTGYTSLVLVCSLWMVTNSIIGCLPTSCLCACRRVWWRLKMRLLCCMGSATVLTWPSIT